MSMRVGICLGDVGGIGPEITVKALRRLRRELPEARFLVVGDPAFLEGLEESRTVSAPSDGFAEPILAWSPSGPLPEGLPPGDPRAARAALAWLEAAARLCLSGRLDAMVTAPVNKAAINRAGVSFTGQTEFLARIAGCPDQVMMLLAPDERGRWLRVALVTTHLALRRVPDAVTEEKVLLACRRAAEACRLLGLPRARVGVAGLNPHAGEQGEFGAEARTRLAPAIARARALGVEAEGPIPADALFYYALQGRYEAVVAMYHDQGLGPLKTIGFERGVNWTLGLPFIRTSPDHGTAYDIAGKGIASPASMIEAIRLAVFLAEGKRSGFRG